MRASPFLARVSPCVLFVLPFVLAVVEACSSAGAASAPPNGGCVDIQPTPADLACTRDEDCAAAVTGVVCAGDIASSLCSNGAANSAGVAKLTAQLLAVAKGVRTDPTDFCDKSAGTLLCFAGQCMQCGDGYLPQTCPVGDGGGGVAPGDGSLGERDGNSATGDDGGAKE